MLLKKLENIKIILGSASPRRRELLAGLDIEFVVDTKNNFEEVWQEETPIKEIPEYLAKGKSYGYHKELIPNQILITADTMVLCNGEIIGKPKDREQAIDMVKRLSDNTHTVLTGVCIRSCDKVRSFTASTTVTFGEVTQEEIEYYIDKYKPYDKAGSYGVQEWIGYMAISAIDGSYYNVMGLPVHRLYKELERF